jgi:hypothetical protein
MSTHTRTNHRLSRHHVVAGPYRAKPERENRRRETTKHNHSIDEFVRRTTAASGVPLLVEDEGVLDQIARVLS